jgi:hypothetical protein
MSAGDRPHGIITRHTVSIRRTTPLLPPTTHHTAPTAHAAPHRSRCPRRTDPLLPPTTHRTAPAAHAAPHRSCCPCPPAPPSLSVVIGRRCGRSFFSLSVVIVIVSRCRCCRSWSWLSVVVIVVVRKKVSNFEQVVGHAVTCGHVLCSNLHKRWPRLRSLSLSLSLSQSKPRGQSLVSGLFRRSTSRRNTSTDMDILTAIRQAYSRQDDRLKLTQYFFMLSP